MATVTDLLIIYTDGEARTIKGVEEYDMGEDGVFRFRKNGYTSFVPKESIRYFGRKFDYETS